jgi:hypothetical protein
MPASKRPLVTAGAKVAVTPARASAVHQAHTGCDSLLDSGAERRQRVVLPAGEADGHDAAVGEPESKVQGAHEPLHRPPARVIEDHPHLDAGLGLSVGKAARTASSGISGSPSRSPWPAAVTVTSA